MLKRKPGGSKIYGDLLLVLDDDRAAFTTEVYIFHVSSQYRALAWSLDASGRTRVNTDWLRETFDVVA
jgi:hypothetical protein